MKEKSVLLAGCGNLGLDLGKKLQQQGFAVTGLKRSAIADPGFSMIQADLAEPASLRALAPRYDYIVYTATPDQMTEVAYETAYLTGLKHLQAQLEAPERLFFVSSTSVYHQNQGEWVDETSPTEPTRFSGKLILQAEVFAKMNWNTTVVRFSGIYGPGRNWLINKVRNGCEVQEEPPKYTNRIHRDDCIGVLLFLMNKQSQGQSLAEQYVCSDNSPVPDYEVLDFVAEQLKCAKPARVLSIEPNETNRARRQNKRCVNRAIKALGYEFIYPDYQAGYRQVIAGL